METLKKFVRSQVGTAALFAAAAALILVGTVGGARAATPPYTARDYVAQIGIPEVSGLVINENGSPAGEDLLDDVRDEGIRPGVRYPEELTVTNGSETTDVYVRVTLHKSWKKGGENADTTLAPSLIELGLAEGNGWVVDEDATTAERVVLYYTGVLPAGGETPAFLESVKVSDRLPALCKQDVDGNVITTTFDYDDATLSLVATVDAVQTHNAEDAILYSWGRDVSVSGGTLSLD